MENFIPGLFKLIEERGVPRRFTTLFLYLIILGITTWMLSLIWGSFILPVSNGIAAFADGWVQDDATRRLLIRQGVMWSVGASLAVLIGIPLSGFLGRKARGLLKKTENLLVIIEERFEEVKELDRRVEEHEEDGHLHGPQE
jgi:hypothetical protein